MASAGFPRPRIVLGDDDIAVLSNGVRILALRELGDRDVAEEVVQETLVRTLEALDSERIGDRDRLGAFVRGVARHVIVDEMRRRGRAADLPGDPPDRTTERDALTALVRSEDRAAVHTALDRLSRTDRDLLELSFMDGLTPRDIAARTDEPAERVRKRKSRALARLRAAFLAEGHDSGPSPTDEVEADIRIGSKRGQP